MTADHQECCTEGEHMSSGATKTRCGPIAAILDFAGATPSDQQRLADNLMSEPRRRLNGCLFHWLKPYPDGFRVIEFWRCQDLFDRFWNGELKPLLDHLGVGEPYVRIEQVPEDVLTAD
jgi:hypothetical protein